MSDIIKNTKKMKLCIKTKKLEHECHFLKKYRECRSILKLEASVT